MPLEVARWLAVCLQQQSPGPSGPEPSTQAETSPVAPHSSGRRGALSPGTCPGALSLRQTCLLHSRMFQGVPWKGGRLPNRPPTHGAFTLLNQKPGPLWGLCLPRAGGADSSETPHSSSSLFS